MLLGQLAALAGAVGWAAGGVAIKTVSSSFSAVQISAVGYWVATVMMVLLVVATGSLDEFAGMPFQSMAWLAGAGVLYTFSDLAFVRLLALGAVGWTFVTTTSLFILFSLLSGVLILGDDMTVVAYIGAAAIVGGIYLINRSGTGALEPWRGLRLRLGISVGVAFVWAAALLMTDVGVEDADPFGAALWLAAVPAAFYVGFAAVSRRARISGAHSRDLRRLLAAALFFGATVLAWTAALKLETAGIAAILTSSSPLFAVVFAALFLRERLNRWSMLGVALCLAGIGFVLSG